MKNSNHELIAVQYKDVDFDRPFALVGEYLLAKPTSTTNYVHLRNDEDEDLYDSIVRKIYLEKNPENKYLFIELENGITIQLQSDDYILVYKKRKESPKYINI